jgi:hypothetical protein
MAGNLRFWNLRPIPSPFHPESRKAMMMNERPRFPKPLVPVQIRAGAPFYVSPQGSGNFCGTAFRLNPASL